MKVATNSSRFISLFFTSVACLLLAAVARAEDLAPYSFDHFFDTSRLVKIDLEVEPADWDKAVSYKHLRANETRHDLV